ncbi:DUF262 domain-containing protein [Arcticibacterium luteifluviistationis]|uniref:DUF262 domain-containing protein n=1 Tax=Arcticibacterium luteifluviistationis TaxID=1784714 RepID=A0A2Z4GGM5_9BACT|nr:DUF262 domain-containing protein [Arcticibacterium luteifluviistationis]AWW00553.1 DUF262 domain-containing protein [Arcticibacterium luteifluviistationis]
MIKYQVRARQLVDLVSEIKRDKLILSPPFQRNLVWRTLHKVDFIKTILLGFPFPQIFLAKGELNAEELTTTSVVVDGQQRMNSILEFIDNEFKVDGKYYRELSKEDRDNFLKYEIAIIELDMESDDPQIIDIFQRLNRTFYSLTKIEKLASEYASSEFMLVAKLISNEISFDADSKKILDTGIPEEFKIWAKSVDFFQFRELIIERPIFTPYEISRKVHLMFALNILGTAERGIFNRNIKDSILDEYKESFESKDAIVDKLNRVGILYNSLKFRKTSYLYNKANFFTLVIVLYNNLEAVLEMSKSHLKEKLLQFEENAPEDYKLAAKEGVNNRKERLLRNFAIENLLLK